MPIHDWTKVDAGIFHDFHHAWIEEIKRTLNRGLLPADYYDLAEQITSPVGPDVLTLRRPAKPDASRGSSGGGACIVDVPPKVRFHAKSLSGKYAAKTKSVVIRHKSMHEIVALIEIVSPGNKDSSKHITAFLNKANDALEAGIQLLILDLFPPGRPGPAGIHR